MSDKLSTDQMEQVLALSGVARVCVRKMLEIAEVKRLDKLGFEALEEHAFREIWYVVHQEPEKLTWGQMDHIERWHAEALKTQ